MNAVKELVIPEDVLENLRMSPDEMRIEFATYLYATKRFTRGRAKRLAGLDLIRFNMNSRREKFTFIMASRI